MRRLAAYGVGSLGACWVIGLAVSGVAAAAPGPQTETQRWALVAVAGGGPSLEITTNQEGGVAVIGGDLHLADSSVVNGPVVVVGGKLARDPQSRVTGTVVELGAPWIRDAAAGVFRGEKTTPKAPEGGLYVTGRDHTVQPGDVVAGDVVVCNGSLKIRGRVDGSVVCLSGKVQLEDGCEVGGSVVLVPTGDDQKLDRADKAIVRGLSARLPVQKPAGAVTPVKPAEVESSQHAGAPQAPPVAEAPEAPAAPGEPMSTVHGGTVMGGNVTVRAGERMDGLFLMGGDVKVEKNAEIDGPVTVFGGNLGVTGALRGETVVFGGNLRMEGELRGNSTVFGGNITVEPTGQVHGNIDCVGGTVRVAKGARVEGDISNTGGTIDIDPGAVVTGRASKVESGAERHPERVIRGLVDAMEVPMRQTRHFGPLLFRSLLLFGVVMLVASAWPSRLETAADYIRRRPVQSGIEGFVTCAGTVLVLALLAIPTCGLSIIGFIPAGVLFAMAYLVGFAAVSLIVGEWVVRRTRMIGSPNLTCVALGTATILAIRFVSQIARPIESLVAWAGFAIAMIAVGAALQTKLGANVDATGWIGRRRWGRRLFRGTGESGTGSWDWSAPWGGADAQAPPGPEAAVPPSAPTPPPPPPPGPPPPGPPPPPPPPKNPGE